MFNDSDREFMTNNMKIVVASIESKLNEPYFSAFTQIAVNAISKYIEAIRNFEASGSRRDLTCHQDNEAEEFIREYYCKLVEYIDDNDVIQILDALRYSFSCYAYNGLHQLYTRQENEHWHPKIKLTDVLSPNDIESLEEVLTIYRGCDITEFENNLFGQSWTTSLDVAKKFAFTHYRNQEWFNENSRVVLVATYSRNHVLFSNQSIEYEVVVDMDKLLVVRKHT